MKPLHRFAAALMLMAAMVSLFLFGYVSTQRVDLSDYAKRDSSNQSPGVQAAINAAKGKTLYVPAGTYFVKNLSGVSGITIEADPGAVFKYYDADSNNFGNHIIGFEGCTDFRIKGLALDGGKTRYGNAIALISSTDFVLDGVSVTNNFGEAIALKFCKRGIITRCSATNTDVGVLLVSGDDDITVSYCNISGGTSDGVAVYGTDTLSDTNIKIRNNKVTNKRNAYSTRYAKYVFVEDNEAYSCDYGFVAEDVVDGTRYIVVTRNKFFDCLSIGIAGSLYMSSVTGNTIINPRVYGCWIGSNLRKQSTQNLIFSNNMVVGGQTQYLFTDLYDSQVFSNSGFKSSYAGFILLVGRRNVLQNNTVDAPVFGYLIDKDQAGVRPERNTLIGNIGTLVNKGINTLVVTHIGKIYDDDGISTRMSIPTIGPLAKDALKSN